MSVQGVTGIILALAALVTAIGKIIYDIRQAKRQGGKNAG